MVNPVIHWFFPHESNNHRPKAIHASVLVWYLSLFLLLQFSLRIIKFSRPEILGFATDINIEKLVNLTNLAREQAGVGSLQLNPELSEAAKLKAEDMFAKNYWAHNAPDGTTPWVFIKDSGYVYVFAGENLARDFVNSEGVVSAWLVSPTHRENILKKEYRDVGFAIVNGKLFGEETTLVVQMFGTKQPSLISFAQNEISTPQARVSSVAAQITQKPFINFFATSKNMASSLTFMLLGVLTVDGICIWKKKIVRVTGHNLAHIIFLLTILGALWFTSQGAIL